MPQLYTGWIDFISQFVLLVLLFANEPLQVGAITPNGSKSSFPYIYMGGIMFPVELLLSRITVLISIVLTN